MHWKSVVIITLAFYFHLSQSIKDDNGFDVVEKVKNIVQAVSGIGGSAPVVSTTYSPEIDETSVETETSEVPQTDYYCSITETLPCCCCAEDHCDL